MTPAEIIRIKRDGRALDEAQIDDFVRGLVDRRWSEGQVAALAMAVLLRGMSGAETALLTRAMTRSGHVLDWSRAGFDAPIVDKHSTGGVGDKVSLMLAPIVAACGAVVPMVSGRGLGHTGGTLDKMQCLAGYDTAPGRARLTRVLKDAGCAIVGASARVAPADRRLYAIRDVTATVESVPLITASILSKKLAAGLQGLVMDVKAGNGAFCATTAEARVLAASLIDVAARAGLPTRALVTDMNQVLGHTAGNALEVGEAIDFLTGRGPREARLEQVTLALAAEMLALCGVAGDVGQGQALARRALDSGAAAERFARMVAALDGPKDVLFARFAGLVRAPVVLDVPAPCAGWLVAMDTREIGLAVVDLGGGRRRADDAIDPGVGLSQVRSCGSHLAAGEPVMRVHARTREQCEAARVRIAAALTLASRRVPSQAVLIERIAAGRENPARVPAEPPPRMV
jgi:thymidine phosphorylase